MRNWQRWMALGFLVIGMAGCQSSCNPTSPSNNNGGSSTPTPTPTYFLNESYEGSPYTGTWVDAAPSAEMSGPAGGAYAGTYSVAFSSSGMNATPLNDHFRNTFVTLSTTVTVNTPLTTSFAFNFGSLSPTASERLKIHLQIHNGTSDIVLWLFEIQGNGTAFWFNNCLLTSCANCPSGAGWHTVTIKNTGTLTTSLSFNGNAAETLPAGYDSYSSGVTPDGLGYGVIHLTMGNMLNSINAKFMMDDLKISTP